MLSVEKYLRMKEAVSLMGTCLLPSRKSSLFLELLSPISPKNFQGCNPNVYQLVGPWIPWDPQRKGWGVTCRIMASACPLLSCPVNHCSSITHRPLPTQGQLVSSKLPSLAVLLPLQTFGKHLLPIRTPTEGIPTQNC